VPCSPCENCSVGNYIKTKCDGTNNIKTPGCVACKNCSSGEYITNCDGGGFNDSDRTCTPCAQCTSGYFRTNCHGNGIRDDSSCQICINSCAANEYRSGVNSCSCTACDDCPRGSFMTSCSVGGRTCVPCKKCNSGQYINASCTGGVTDNTECGQCSPCANGQVFGNGCSGTEYDNNRTCTMCPVCALDHYMNKCDGRDNKTTCTPCKSYPQDSTLTPVQFPGFASPRCTGSTNNDNTQYRECVCPISIKNLNTFNPLTPSNVDQEACEGVIPTHHCIIRPSITNSSLFYTHMADIGLKSIAMTVGYADTQVRNALLDPNDRIWMLGFRTCVINTNLLPQIQSIILDPARNQYNIRLWIVYESDTVASIAFNNFQISGCTGIYSGLRIKEQKTIYNTIVVSTTPTPPVTLITFTLNGVSTIGTSLSLFDAVIQAALSDVFTGHTVSLLSVPIPSLRRLLSTQLTVVFDVTILKASDVIDVLSMVNNYGINRINEKIWESGLSIVFTAISYIHPYSNASVVVGEPPNPIVATPSPTPSTSSTIYSAWGLLCWCLLVSWTLNVGVGH
jgi:hypothetical protein